MQTVLIIDDEPTIRRLVSGSLEAAAYRVLEAADGFQGLEISRAHQPDLILLDIALPHMSGLEVCRRLKADSATARIPILYLTGLAPDVERRAASESDVAGFIAKPFSPAGLVLQIARTLDASHAVPAS